MTAGSEYHPGFVILFGCPFSIGTLYHLCGNVGRKCPLLVLIPLMNLVVLDVEVFDVLYILVVNILCSFRQL